MSDDLIIGAAVGQTVGQVAPVLDSLRRTGYSGRIVLFVDRALEQGLRANRGAGDVTLIRARQWLPFSRKLIHRRKVMRYLWLPLQVLGWLLWRAAERMPLPSKARFEFQLRLAAVLYTPMETRFLLYRRYLRRHPAERVLLSDVRDVLFQREPFASLPQEGLAVSMESPSYTLATEPHNAAWIARGYGQAVLEEIGENRVSCVGVTYGDRASISAYLDLMSAEILRLPPSRIGMGGADTAIHNVLLGKHRLGRVHRMETLAGPVATLNGIDQHEVRLSSGGRLQNADGREPSVIHQYDRVPGLASRLLRALAE